MVYVRTAIHDMRLRASQGCRSVSRWDGTWDGGWAGLHMMLQRAQRWGSPASGSRPATAAPGLCSTAPRSRGCAGAALVVRVPACRSWWSSWCAPTLSAPSSSVDLNQGLEHAISRVLQHGLNAGASIIRFHGIRLWLVPHQPALLQPPPAAQFDAADDSLLLRVLSAMRGHELMTRVHCPRPTASLFSRASQSVRQV